MGHLWLYIIFDENGYGEYLKELIEYSIKKKNALFEWEIVDDIEKNINAILNKYGIQFSKYLSDNFSLMDYKDIDEKSKDKDQPLMRLTRLLIMAELEMAEQIFDCKKDLKNLLEDEGNIINATYLLVTMMSNRRLSQVISADYIRWKYLSQSAVNEVKAFYIGWHRRLSRAYFSSAMAGLK